MTPDGHARVKSLFLKASQLDPADRPAFLERCCAGDEELRRELESLLSHHTQQTILAPATKSGVQAPTRSSLTAHRTALRAMSRLTGGLAMALFGTRGRALLTAAIVFVLVVALGWWSYGQLERSLRGMLASQLKTLLEADVGALEFWIEERLDQTQMWASDERVQQAAQRLVEFAQSIEESKLAEALATSDDAEELRQLLKVRTHRDDNAGFAVVDRSGLVLAARSPENQGLRLNARGVSANAAVFEGRRTMIGPVPTLAFAPLSKVVYDEPAIWFSAPIHNDEGHVAASLNLGEKAEANFTKILKIARVGKTGETYAFDDRGLLLSESLFPEHLEQAGLLEAGASPILNVSIRDPGGDLTAGHPLPASIDAQPLTRMAAHAVAGEHGVDVDGYRDYRGVMVVGAWKWLPEHGLGVATEIDYAEAYAPLRYPLLAFWLRFALLGACIAAMLVSGVKFVRMQRTAEAARRLGQYTLEEKLGEGGIGVVYKARHALLRRPTAVKLLRPEQITAEALARFEREVQLASLLSHPHTIDIYDFGRTPDGAFYYAMEFVPGISLSELVELEGAIPPQRAVSVLRQVCGSLKEAHSIGLVHRDIKPPNIMLGERGGEFDFVKVLDFGLVKQVADPNTTQLTSPAVISGTPMYMAPERLTDAVHVDARADIYSLGVVAFNLLTGRQIFEVKSSMAILHHVLNVDPPRPSERMERPIPPALDQLVVDCLQKEPSARPQSIAEVVSRLDCLRELPPWTQDDARAWWTSNAERLGMASRPREAGEPLAVGKVDSQPVTASAAEPPSDEATIKADRGCDRASLPVVAVAIHELFRASTFV